jgi:hypothetical protein
MQELFSQDLFLNTGSAVQPLRDHCSQGTAWVSGRFGNVHVLLTFQAYRIQQLQGHGGVFHQDFQGTPGRPGSAW